MVGVLVMIVAAGVLLWALGNGRKGARNGAMIAFAVGVLFTVMEASAPVSSTSAARHGLSAGRMESQCLDRVASQLASPGSMRVLGNPVGADPVWDSAESEWRWIVDVTAVNAFNARVRGRFQCVVRAGPSWTVRQVN